MNVFHNKTFRRRISVSSSTFLFLCEATMVENQPMVASGTENGDQTISDLSTTSTTQRSAVTRLEFDTFFSDKITVRQGNEIA